MIPYHPADFDVNTCFTLEDFREANRWLNEQLNECRVAIEIAKANNSKGLIDKLASKIGHLKVEIRITSNAIRELKRGGKQDWHIRYTNAIVAILQDVISEENFALLDAMARTRLRTEDAGKTTDL